MLKRLILFIFLIFILSAGVSAGVETLYPDQAVKLTLDNNIELDIASFDLENAKIDYQKSKLNNLKTESNYLRIQAELALFKAREEFYQTKSNLIIDTVDSYLSLIEMEQEITIEEKQLELEKGELKEVKAQVKVGNKSSLDLFEQQNDYQTAKFDLEKTRDDYQQLLKEFKIKIGLNLEGRIKLAAVKRPEIQEIREEKSLSTAEKNNALLKIRKKELKLARVDLNRAELAATPELDLKKLRNNLKLAELGYSKEKLNLDNIVQKQYYLYKQSARNMELTYQNLLQVKENYETIHSQEKAGLLTKNDLLTAEISVLENRKKYFESISSYYINKLQLQQAMDLEIGVDINVLAEKE